MKNISGKTWQEIEAELPKRTFIDRLLGLNRYHKQIGLKSTENWFRYCTDTGTRIPNSEYIRHVVYYIITDRQTKSQQMEKEYLDNDY